MTKLFLILGIVLVFIFAAYAEPPDGYEWSSPIGALKRNDKNPNAYIFDTTPGNHLTSNKQIVVPYNTRKDNELTDLGKTLKGKLLKIDGIADVAVEYRRLWIQKFPLDDWAVILPEMQKVLK